MTHITWAKGKCNGCGRKDIDIRLVDGVAVNCDYCGHHVVEIYSTATTTPNDTVDHPPHYGGADNLYEAIKVIEAWDLGFHLGNTIKYICRHGKKEGITDDGLRDLKKARWYLDREIANREARSNPIPRDSNTESTVARDTSERSPDLSIGNRGSIK